MLRWKKNLFIFLGIILFTSIQFPKLIEGAKSKGGGKGKKGKKGKESKEDKEERERREAVRREQGKSKGQKAHEESERREKQCKKVGGTWTNGRCTTHCADKKADNYGKRARGGCRYTCKDKSADNTGDFSGRSDPCIYKCRDLFQKNAAEGKPKCPSIDPEECKKTHDADGKIAMANKSSGQCCDGCAGNPKQEEAKKKEEKKGISFICTALYRNKHISKTDYRLMTLFGILAVKTKKYEKDMMLYFTCMKHLMPYVEKIEKENKQFWNNLKIFFVSCIKNLKEEKYDNVIKLFTVKSISMAEKYCGGLKNIPKLSNKNYNLYKGIYKKNKERYNISAKSFLKLI